MQILSGYTAGVGKESFLSHACMYGTAPPPADGSNLQSGPDSLLPCSAQEDIGGHECLPKCCLRTVDAEFRNGAELALEIAKKEGVELAILQPRSPSCGCGQIYDGTFTRKLIPGNGIFAQLLIDNGIKVVQPSQLSKIVF